MAPKHIFIFLTILLLLPALAHASFTDEWGEFQDDETSRGFMHDGTGHFDDGIGITYSDITDGMNYQPLIVNMTGDGNLETIIYSGNFLQLYNEEMTLIDETNIGATQSQPVIYNNGSINIAVSISSNTLEAWSYNGTNFIDNFANDTQLNRTFGIGVWSGLRCIEDLDLCYSVVSDVGLANTYVIEINMTSATFINSTPLSPNEVFGVPAIADINNNGDNQLVYTCDADSNNFWGLCVVDLPLLILDVSFSGDGILDGLGSGVNRYASPIIWNVDGGGHSEIIFTGSQVLGGAGDDIAIGVYNSDGSLEWFTEWDDAGTNQNWFSQAVIVDNGGADTQWDICTSATRNTLTTVYVLCTDNEGVILNTFSFASGVTDFPQAGFPMIAADMDSDGLDELVFAGQIVEINGSVIVNTTFDNTYYTAIADVNIDGELEIISTKSGATSIFYSSFVNAVPELNNTQNYGGYGATLDYTTPICVGSTLTFLAQECGGLGTCNYDNDGSEDTERIVSNCGQLASGAASTSFITNLANGTFTGASPSFQCVYNVTGIFSVRLFLQDNFNDADFTQYNTQTITVQVINGTAGITCNLGTAVSPGDTGGIVPSAQESQTNEAVEDTLGILFGTGAGSDKLKLIVGIALILGIIAAAYREGVNSGAGILTVAGFATLLVTFIGLITPAIFILGFAFVIFIIFIGRAIVGGGAPNGGP